MKHLERPEKPEYLTTHADKWKRILVDLYDNTPEEKRKDIDFPFNSDVYNHSSVKPALLKAQNATCCYCETRLVGTFGEIEHFRPKDGYVQDKNNKALHKPGYYWLTYEWNNLLVACSVCNNNKKNFFPLANVDVRDSAIKGRDVKEEKAYIINPYEVTEKEIKRHIGFIGALEVGLSKKGYYTISCCGLNRPSLTRDRYIMLNKLVEMKMAISLYESKFGEEGAKMKEQELKDSIKQYLKEGEYTLMLRCNFKEYIED